MHSRVILLLAAGIACAEPYQPAADELAAIRNKVADLSGRLDHLRSNALRDDVEVYRKAGEWILRYPEEFYTKVYVANALKALDHGIARAQELEQGDASWPRQKGRLVRAYRSRVDGSVQPYP